MLTVRRSRFLLTLAMAGFGTIGLFTVNADMPALALTFWRCAFAAVALVLVCLLTGAFAKTTFSCRAVLLTLLGGVALVANWILLTTAFQHTSITTATVAYHSEPFFLVLLGAVVTKVIPTRREWGWLIVAACGLILGTGLLTVQGLDTVGVDVFGVASAVGAGFLYAVVTLAAQRTQRIDPAVMTLMQVTVGIVLLLPFAMTLDVGSTNWMWVAAMGIIHTGVLYAVMYAALPALRFPVVAAIAFVNPAVAILIDAVAYANTPTALQVVGLIAIGAATLGTTLAPAQNGRQDVRERSGRLSRLEPS